MKKLALAVAVTGALGAYGVANAATVSEFANGVLVPYVKFDSSTDTAIGLTSCAKGDVYWTFFDPNSKHVQDNTIPMTENDQYNFSWSSVAGAGLSGQLGYMVFVLDTTGDGALTSSDSPCLTGAAFYLDPSNNAVDYIPTPPLYVSDFDTGSDPSSVSTPNGLRSMDSTSLTGLSAGAHAASGDTLYMRYLIDNQPGGIDTSIVIWSAQDLSGGWTVEMFDNNQDSGSVNINLPNAELNVLDPETINGRDPNFTDGFIMWDLGQTWDPSASDKSDGVLSFSMITEGSKDGQTIVNPYVHGSSSQ